MYCPSVSVVIPTLNAEKYLDLCLYYLTRQNYPKGKIEIIIVDGGSKDKTISIAQKYKTRILNNSYKTSEAGKAKGIRHSKNELILLIDSDNLIESSDWISKMVYPLKNNEVIASEPLYYTYRKTDSMINRYCALIGMNDPICMFLGNYDRFNYITNRWTEIPIEFIDKGKYIEFKTLGKNFMTMGANGFLVRKEYIVDYCKENFYFDVDVTKDLAVNRRVTFAKVKIGIVHVYADNISQFIKKQKRRIKDFLFFQKKRNYSISNKYNSQGDIHIFGLLKFSFYTIMIFPLLYQATKGWGRKKDNAWLFHPIACWTTLWVYIIEYLKYYIVGNHKMMQRDGW